MPAFCRITTTHTGAARFATAPTAVRNNLADTLNELVPDADVDCRLIRYGYRDATDFIGRNTESFCADVMAFFKFIFNFFTQLIGKMK